MSKLRDLMVAGCLTAVSAGSFASGVCEGFEVSLKNTNSDDFMIEKVELTNGELEPGQPSLLKSGTEQVLTVNKASPDEAMEGSITLKRVSLPTKTAKIHFTLKDKKAFCEHSEQDSSGPVEKSRTVGGVNYTIVKQ